MGWDGMGWNVIRLDGMGWDRIAIRSDGSGWDEIGLGNNRIEIWKKMSVKKKGKLEKPSCGGVRMLETAQSDSTE